MRRFGFLVLILALARCPAPAGAQSVVQETIRAAAVELAEAGHRRQDDRMIDLLYPPMVEMGGGREKVKIFLQQLADRLAAQGIKRELSEIGQPGEPVASGGKLFSIVPRTVRFTSPKTRTEQEIYLLAISLDQGKTWTFIDGLGLTPEILKPLFPDLPPGLVLPEPQKSKVTPLP